MKKLLCVLISMLLMLTSFVIFASATSEDETSEYQAEHNFVVDGVEHTVIFSDNQLSPEKQKSVAMKLVGAEGSETAPSNIWCDLFGHDMVSTSDVTEITHKVRSTAPRCNQNTYSVSVCEDCGYQEQILKSSVQIYCCS